MIVVNHAARKAANYALIELGETKSSIARELELSIGYVSDVLNGKQVPSEDLAKKLGKRLGIDWQVFRDA